MFGYLNLMLIKLLMMNLHAQVCIYVYLCFCSKLVKYNVVVDEFTSDCCCCCYEKLLLMIETLGNLNHRA